MSVSNKIKGLMGLKMMLQKDVADYFEMSQQAFRNKLARGSFSAEDLIKIAEVTGAELCFLIGDQKITLTMDDIRNDKE